MGVGGGTAEEAELGGVGGIGTFCSRTRYAGGGEGNDGTDGPLGGVGGCSPWCFGERDGAVTAMGGIATPAGSLTDLTCVAQAMGLEGRGG